MAGVQPNHKPAIQAGLQWLKDNGHNSCASDQPSEPHLTKRFIPRTALRNHFDYTRLTSIIEALRPEYQQFECQRIARSILREGYQLVFCILLRINKAQHIETFLHHDLSDKILPVDQKPHGFPDSVSFDAFRDKQRPFCAYTLFGGMVKSIAPDTIIAIVSREELAKGDGTTISKIQLHSDYDGLQNNDVSVGDHLAHTYVLKVYNGPDAQKHHDAEVEAYGKIQAGGQHIDSLLRYYGTYTYEGLNHIVLEYADQGTLEDYLRSIERPTKGVDIIALWHGIFDLAQAISRVHMQRGQVARFQKWHQDIDLKNILVRSKPGVSPYSWSFKLADYGRSHFKASNTSSLLMTDYDTFGTKMHGAPECYRPDRFTRTTRLQVPQGVDIWSLGCVWSEVAVWVVQGSAGLDTYRERRTTATEALELENPGCFHDGEKVLPCIREVHEGLRWLEMSDEDYLTGNVWHDLIEKMLCSNGHQRPSSRELRQETSKRLSEAGHRLSELNRNTLSRAQTVPYTNETDSIPGHRRRDTSPSMDPSMVHTHSGLIKSPRDSLEGHKGSSTLPPIRNPNQARHRPTTVDGNNIFDDGGVGPSTPPRSSSSSRGSRGQHSPTFVKSSTMQLRGSPPGRGRSSNLIEQRRHTVPREHVTETVAEEVEGDFYDATESPIAEELEGGLYDEPESWQTKDFRLPDRSVTGKQRSSSAENVASARSIPVLELLVAFHWMSEKKKGDRHAALPYGDQLKGLLRNRDHLFLIDDSTSMYASRPELCSLFELLAYIVEDDDPDGVEVLCANTGVSLKEKDSSKLSEHVNNNIKWKGRTHLESRLAQILGAYGEKLLARGPRPKRPVTPLTVYILTDGVWQGGGEPEVPIMELVYTLANLGLDRKQVGVQFIVFGENRAGLQHLDKIDDMQGPYTLPLDIVDTERANGNVWKMLRGAIDDVFDDGV
ncbi:hypothetical protein LTR10_009237 [Elasticomyces elasticus]|nr:hypothetical protein LTR10_009237 [Elasticomyces elasticus]KAK4971663.1 hypothetical protein LTR42_007391 [Elasticomyces elasticus]